MLTQLDVTFVPYSADRERHVLTGSRRYNLKETIHIFYVIKQYSKHENISRQNVLLKQRVTISVYPARCNGDGLYRKRRLTRGFVL